MMTCVNGDVVGIGVNVNVVGDTTVCKQMPLLSRRR